MTEHPNQDPHAVQAGSRKDLVRLRGGELYYEVAGDGETVVLLHPGVADASFWDVAFWALAQQHTVVRYDRRGYGRSSAAHQPFRHGDDLRQLLGELGAGAVHLVGCSAGGEVALDHALLHPESVRSLTLVSSSVSGFTPSGPPPADLLELFEVLGAPDASRDAGRTAPERAVELALRLWLIGPARPPEMVDPRLRRQLQPLLESALMTLLPTASLEVPLYPPALDRLHEVSVPTLILTGELDDPLVLRLADAVAAGIDGSSRVTLLGTAHLLPLERPARFQELLEAFLARTTGGAGLSGTRATLRSLYAS